MDVFQHTVELNEIKEKRRADPLAALGAREGWGGQKDKGQTEMLGSPEQLPWKGRGSSEGIYNNYIIT